MQGHLEYVVDGVNSYFVDFDDEEAAKAKMATIINTGLVPGALPEFQAVRDRLRKSDFAKEFHGRVLALALHQAERRRTRLCSEVLEPVVRAAAFILWVVTFFLMRLVTRTVFYFSTSPRFQVLGQLGGSIETEDASIYDDDQAAIR